VTPKQLEFVNDALKETVTRWKRKKPNGPWYRRVLFWLKCQWDLMDMIEPEQVRVPRECPDCEEPMRVHGTFPTAIYNTTEINPYFAIPVTFIVVLCDRCGRVEFFNAHVLNLVDEHGGIRE
jgi:predicted nucleic-acid-binding Zn-ribbon protein